MFAVVFFGLSAAYLGMGADRAFKPGVYDISTLWIVIWAIVSVAAALLGGAVCALIATTRTPVIVLAALVLLLGAAQAVGVTRPPKTPPAPPR